MKRFEVSKGYSRSEASVSSLNEEARTVELVFTTGYKGLRRGWDGNYYEQLSLEPGHVDMSRLNGGAPLLAVHDQFNLDAVVGVVESARLEGDKGVATVRFAKDERSEAIFQKVKDKILRNVSVGYNVQQYTDITRDGETIPTLLATRWTPAELSIVPIGFDPHAQVRASSETNLVEVIKPTNNADFDTAKETRMDKKAVAEQAVEQERTRVLEIRKAVEAAGLDAKMAEEYIERGTSVEDAKTNIELFAKYKREQPVISGAAPRVTMDERDKKREAVVESLLYRIDNQNFKPAQGNPLIGYSMLRAMEAVIPRRHGMTDSMFARAAMSSSDLPYILANVAEKSAQKKYELQPASWSLWAKTDTVRNFKTHDRVRSGDFASLEERQESGEFKRGSFGEEREQVALKEYGKIMGFTRRMLINDDLGEIAKVAAQAGIAAVQLENDLVYGQLTGSVTMGDGNPLFDAAHGNLGTGAALTDASIGEAVKLMRLQESVDGLHKLNLAPKFLICGPDQEVAARKYLAQISPAQSSNVNPFSNSLQLVVDAAISNNDYFFAADPALIDTVVLFHLEGEERPRVESRTKFETEEVEIKVAHSAVAKAMDWRGLVKNANAS